METTKTAPPGLFLFVQEVSDGLWCMLVVFRQATIAFVNSLGHVVASAARSLTSAAFILNPWSASRLNALVIMVRAPEEMATFDSFSLGAISRLAGSFGNWNVALSMASSISSLAGLPARPSSCKARLSFWRVDLWMIESGPFAAAALSFMVFILCG